MTQGETQLTAKRLTCIISREKNPDKVTEKREEKESSNEKGEEKDGEDVVMVRPLYMLGGAIEELLSKRTLQLKQEWSEDMHKHLVEGRKNWKRKIWRKRKSSKELTEEYKLESRNGVMEWLI
jgi:hypothetical protein